MLNRNIRRKLQLETLEERCVLSALLPDLLDAQDDGSDFGDDLSALKRSHHSLADLNCLYVGSGQTGTPAQNSGPALAPSSPHDGGGMRPTPMGFSGTSAPPILLTPPALLQIRSPATLTLHRQPSSSVGQTSRQAVLSDQATADGGAQPNPQMGTSADNPSGWQVTVVVGGQANTNWYVPVDASDYNRSPWVDSTFNNPLVGIPEVRDFDPSVRNLPVDDPNLVNMGVTAVKPNPNGFGMVPVSGTYSVTVVSSGNGDASLWWNARKSAPFAPVQVVGGVGLFVEGTHESAALNDVTIHVDIQEVNNGGHWTGDYRLTVTPVLNSFTGTSFDQNINFTNYNNPPNIPSDGLDGLVARQMPGNTPSMNWNANLYASGVSMGYVQNVEDVINNANGSGAGWVYVQGTNAPKRFYNLLPGAGLELPMNDSDNLLYPSGSRNNANGTTDVASNDGPSTDFPRAADGTPLFTDETQAIDYKVKFKLWLVATYNDGPGGAFGSIYPIANMEWSVNFFANGNVPFFGVGTIYSPWPRVSLFDVAVSA